MSAFLDNLIKISGSNYISKVSDGNESDIGSYVGTGSYSLNALISGSIYGGIAGNKVTAFAGDPSTGKTFYALEVAKDFLSVNKTGVVFYFETENAVTTDQLTARGIDLERFVIAQAVTVQDFRTQIIKIIDAYLELPEKQRQPMFFVLDSLGGLSTEKEIGDMSEGKDTRDMTRAQLVKGTFRVITLKLGRAKCALLMVNHVYDTIGGMFPEKVMGGGTGLQYAASSIIFLSKSKSKDSQGNITGAVIKAKTYKSRLTKEQKIVATLLDHSVGLNKYYGLLDIAEKYGIVKKISTKYEFPGQKSAFESAIYKNPEKYFTKEILDQIDEACGKEFKYGGKADVDTMDTEED